MGARPFLLAADDPRIGRDGDERVDGGICTNAWPQGANAAASVRPTEKDDVIALLEFMPMSMEKKSNKLCAGASTTIIIAEVMNGM